MAKKSRRGKRPPRPFKRDRVYTQRLAAAAKEARQDTERRRQQAADAEDDRYTEYHYQMAAAFDRTVGNDTFLDNNAPKEQEENLEIDAGTNAGGAAIMQDDSVGAQNIEGNDQKVEHSN